MSNIVEGLPIITIKRNERTRNGIYSTVGITNSYGENELFAVAGEHARLQIPHGEYQPFKTHYIRGGYPTYEIPVMGRTRILFHRGNNTFDDPATPENEADTAGCILIAESFGILKGRTAIQGSLEGFTEFMQRLKGVEKFKLVILEKY